MTKKRERAAALNREVVLSVEREIRQAGYHLTRKTYLDEPDEIQRLDSEGNLRNVEIEAWFETETHENFSPPPLHVSVTVETMGLLRGIRWSGIEFVLEPLD